MNYLQSQKKDVEKHRLLIGVKLILLVLAAIDIAFLGDYTLIYTKFSVIGFFIQAITTFYWIFIARKNPFQQQIAFAIFFNELMVLFLFRYPVTTNILLFISNPLLIMAAAGPLFSQKYVTRLWVASLIFVSFSTLIFALQGMLVQPLSLLLGQWGMLSAIAYLETIFMNRLSEKENHNKRLKKQLEEENLQRTTLEQQLKELQAGSRDLTRDIKKREIELQNILTLSEQVQIGNDSKSILKSFLLTALGQIGSVHGFIMGRINADKSHWELITEKGLHLSKEELQEFRLYLDSNLITTLRSIREPVALKTLPTDSFYSDELWFVGKFSEDVICPIFSKMRLIGLVAFGPKVTRTPFDRRDRNLISILANQCAFILEQVRLTEEFRLQFSKTVRVMLLSLEAKFSYMQGHLLRTTDHVTQVARHMGFNQSEIQGMAMGALLHDIGKTAVYDKFFAYNGTLQNNAEDKRLKNQILAHTLEGAKILKSAGYPSLCVDMALHHHEYFNGTGFPDGIGSEEIPLATRILAVCNAYDAMRTNRPYRKALPQNRAVELLLQDAGQRFDPEIVHAFMETINFNTRKVYN